MRKIILAVVSSLALSAPASVSIGAEPDYTPVFKALFSHMAKTYVCRDQLGGLAHYQAARTIAIGTISRLIDANEAVKLVDEMDQRFRNDPRTTNAPISQQTCMEEVNESLHQIEVEKAKASLLN